MGIAKSNVPGPNHLAQFNAHEEVMIVAFMSETNAATIWRHDAGLVSGSMSIPKFKKYLRIRSMFCADKVRHVRSPHHVTSNGEHISLLNESLVVEPMYSMASLTGSNQVV